MKVAQVILGHHEFAFLLRGATRRFVDGRASGGPDSRILACRSSSVVISHESDDAAEVLMRRSLQRQNPLSQFRPMQISGAVSIGDADLTLRLRPTDAWSAGYSLLSIWLPLTIVLFLWHLLVCVLSVCVRALMLSPGQPFTLELLANGSVASQTTTAIEWVASVGLLLLGSRSVARVFLQSACAWYAKEFASILGASTDVQRLSSHPRRSTS